MIDVIINILNKIIGEDDYIKEAENIENLLKNNKDVHIIYLADKLQLSILISKGKFVDIDDCINIIKNIKSSKEASL